MTKAQLEKALEIACENINIQTDFACPVSLELNDWDCGANCTTVNPFLCWKKYFLQEAKRELEK